jgi:hypothetical protein
MGREKKCIQDLVGKLEERSQLRRPSRRWDDKIKMNIKEDGVGVDWIDPVKDTDKWWNFVNTAMNLRVS